MESFRLCDESFGGVWVPGANSSRTYIPLTCNREPHVDETHWFFDDMSGMKIQKEQRGAYKVDQRGCPRESV